MEVSAQPATVFFGDALKFESSLQLARRRHRVSSQSYNRYKHNPTTTRTPLALTPPHLHLTLPLSPCLTRCLSSLQSPFIVPVYGVVDLVEGCGLVLQHIPKSLMDFIHPNLPAAYQPPLFQRLSLLLDVTLGLSHMHGANLVHGAVCPEHIAVTESHGALLAKLTDVADENIQPPIRCRAPEGGRLPKGDVFGLGITAWESVSCLRAFGQLQDDQITAEMLGTGPNFDNSGTPKATAARTQTAVLRDQLVVPLLDEATRPNITAVIPMIKGAINAFPPVVVSPPHPLLVGETRFHETTRAGLRYTCPATWSTYVEQICCEGAHKDVSEFPSAAQLSHSARGDEAAAAQQTADRILDQFQQESHSDLTTLEDLDAFKAVVFHLQETDYAAERSGFLSMEALIPDRERPLTRIIAHGMFLWRKHLEALPAMRQPKARVYYRACPSRAVDLETGASVQWNAPHLLTASLAPLLASHHKVILAISVPACCENIAILAQFHGIVSKVPDGLDALVLPGTRCHVDSVELLDDFKQMVHLSVLP